MSNTRKYVPPHLRGDRKPVQESHTAADRPFRDASFGAKDTSSRRFTGGPGKVLFFGDSFVRMFGLIEHRNLAVHAFKGASAKGLGRAQNENRANIYRIVQTASTAERLIFLFGSVDVHLSYYYKKYTLSEGELDLNEIANNYVDFVASLPVNLNTKRTIVGIYPSPLEDEVVGASLASMGSISEELIPVVDAADDSKVEARQRRVKQFNEALSKRCQEHSLEYVDAYNDVIDGQSNIIKDIYRDVSDYNIHIVWETTMLMWLEKWPWLKEYIARGFEDKLRQTLKEYLKTKPWAERTHVTQAGSAWKS